jgi:hypothetical protein
MMRGVFQAVEDLQLNAHTEFYVELPAIRATAATIPCDVPALSRPLDDAVFRESFCPMSKMSTARGMS